MSTLDISSTGDVPPGVVNLAQALRVRIDGQWPAIIRDGVQVLGPRQQFTVVDHGHAHHGASFEISVSNLCESALALTYAEVVARFAPRPATTCQPSTATLLIIRK